MSRCFQRAAAVVALLSFGPLTGCGDDATECAAPELRCVASEAQACSDDGRWETILVCENGTSCSLAINTCLVLEGRSPCCL